MDNVGYRITLEANYLRVEVDESKGIYQYRVQFSPPVDSRNRRFALIRQLGHIIGKARAYDGELLKIPYKLQEKVSGPTVTLC